MNKISPLRNKMKLKYTNGIQDNKLKYSMEIINKPFELKIFIEELSSKLFIQSEEFYKAVVKNALTCKEPVMG